MENHKITVRAPRELIIKLKSILALKDTTITRWLLQKMQEEIDKQD
jgi:hypothetical protein